MENRWVFLWSNDRCFSSHFSNFFHETRQLHAFEKRTCREELPLRVPDRNKGDEISFFHEISTSYREKGGLSDFFIDVFLQIL